MQIGYSEREIGRMKYAKFCELFEEYKKLHNMSTKRMIYIDPENPVSMEEI